MSALTVPRRPSSVLAAAIKLAASGIPVFPCKPNKTPYTEHGFKDASCGNAIIAEWWTRWPDALIGTPTGTWFDVLDLDLQHEPARHWLKEHRDRLPVTRTHLTRSGGLHLLFKHDDAMRCSAGRIESGVDTRSTGGYIIWWPAAGFPIPSNALLAPWPDWLLTEFRPKPRPSSAISNTTISQDNAWLRGLVRTVVNASIGERNSVLFWASCRAGEAVRDGKTDEAFITDVLVEASARAGLPEREAHRTIQSGIRRHD